MRKELMELLGTFFLVFTIGLSRNPVAIASVLAIMIYIGGHISGGHFNPAVSFGVFLQKKLSGKEFGMYVLAQLVGGVLACLLVPFFTGRALVVAPQSSVSMLVPFAAEVIFTFVLVFTVLNVALPKAVAGNQYYGLAIGLSVLVGALSVGTISGGAFNPAVGLSPLFADIATIGENGSKLLLYSVAPLLGGALASLVYTLVHEK